MPDFKKIKKAKGKRIKCPLTLFPFSFICTFVPDAYFMLARASLTAAKKNKAVNGMLIPNIIAVFCIPKSGCPEVSSNIEPTAAIAAMQEPSKNKPAIGVIVFMSIYPYFSPYTIDFTA